MSNANQNNANRNLSQPQDGREQFDAAAASMNFPGRLSRDCHSLQRLHQEIV